MLYVDRKARGARYPLPTSGSVEWLATDDGYCAVLDLPPCPSDHIIVPSFSMTGDAYRFQFDLADGSGNHWQLNAVPGRKIDTSVHIGSAVRTHIDCYHTQRDLAQSQLSMHINIRPETYLFTVSVRPIVADPVAPLNQQVAIDPPIPISQMQAPEKIRRGICSPTSMAMLLNRPRREGWLDFVETCRDPITGMYGVWPLAVHAASRQGHLGAVEVFAGWSDVLMALGAGRAVVASIRFGQDELPGAPLNKTSGHLVVVYGVQGDTVMVMDPAALEHAGVARRYDLQAFSRAWFAHRGAGYILAS